MGIAAIRPNEIQKRSEQSKVSNFGGVGFSDVAGAVGAPLATAATIKGGYQPGAVTAMAVSGIAGAPAAFGGASGAPYLGTTGTPFGSGGYGYGGATFAGGYNGYSGSVSVPGAPGGPGMAGGPSQDFQEKQYLFQQMNDANWQMLTAQITVNELSKNYQASSNILKTKSDTELNAVRNMRA